MKNLRIVICVIALLASCKQDKDDLKQSESKKEVSKYQTSVIVKSPLRTMIKLPGQLVAFQEVSIFPKVNGYVSSVKVDIGSRVHKGQLLMTLDAPELIQASLQAKEKYARTKSDYANSKDRYLRLLEASETAGSISPLDLSFAQHKMQADSSLCNAEKANWQMQETMLSYLEVTAPFDGVITERNVHPGALVNSATKDKPMLELKENKHLRLQVDIPEAIAAQLKNKDTVSFYVSAFPGKKMIAYISRKAMNISSQLHSEKIEMDVWNSTETLSPGMYADVMLYSKGSAEAYTVSKTAVVTSTERKYVIVVRAGKTVKKDVVTGNETTDKIEVFGTLQDGDIIITKANDEIKEGAEIK